jgi:peroxiredoxin
MAVSSFMLPLGTEAPDFDLADPSGARVRRDDAVGEHGLLVMFVCNHCPYVKHVGRELGLLTQRWMARGLGVVGINSNDAAAYPDDAPEHMVTAARGWGWDFPYLVDEDQDAAKAYRAACTPDFFLFDRDLGLVYRGQMDSSRPRSGVPVTGEDLAAAVDALVAGHPVPTEQTPSMGCSIKWRPGNEPT